MNRRTLLGTAAAAGAMTVFAPAVAAPRRKPNIILIFCDDMGYRDIGPYGNKLIPTPNLDKFAREGIKLTNYYSADNVCTPSRAGMLTGKYAIHTGVYHGEAQLPLSNPTIPKTLKAAGYVSALLGKWGLAGNAGDGPAWPPTNLGYDYYYGIPNSHDKWPSALYEAHAGSQDLVKTEIGPTDATTPNVRTVEEEFYRHGEKFIEENAGRPFYVNFCFSAPHLPSWPPREFIGKSRAGDYGDVIVQLDSLVGRLMAKLRQLNLDNDTLVAFTSDNGPWFWGSDEGLRARKDQPGYDGGYKLPFLARYPGVIPAGVESDTIMDGVDIHPTFAGFAGVPVPATADLDGFDMSAVLIQRGKSPREELLLFQSEDLVGVRTQRWKYIRNVSYSPISPEARAYDYRELYDMEKDPGENYNVSDTYPAIAKQMEARFERARERFGPMRSKPEKQPSTVRFYD
jgi:arylsulfatase A-like enzyme